MISKISNSYSISIYTSVLDVGKANEIVEVSTSLNAHSRLGGSSATEKYWSFSKNPKEIPKKNYRNGILHESSLMSYLGNNKIYVSNGEVQIGGITSFIQPRSSVEVATQSSTGSAISLDSFWSAEAEITTPVRRKKATLNFLSSNIYEIKKGNYTFAMAPNEVDDFDYIPYMGYAFNEELDGLIVNNYLVKSGNFSSGLRDNTSFSDLSSEDRNASLADGSFKAFCEYLGKGRESGYNSTFRLKYSPASEGYSTTPFEAGRTTILSRNKNTGAVTIYKTYDSYLEAESEAKDNADGNACYFDRYTGKISFCKKTLSSSSQFIYKKPIGAQPGDNLPIDKYLHLNTDAFDDNGYIAIENGEEPTIVVPFWKLSKNKILIQTSITFPANCVISHYSYLNTVDSNEEVYAYYAPCVGLSTANGLGPQQHIEKSLEPWLWSGQKTIAVLGKNKMYPYKITLKAVGINYLRRGERTSTFVYGPLANQNEIVYLEGQVLSESNDPIINQEVTVFIAEGKGLINGAVSTSVITNDLGIFYATYSPGDSEFNWITFKAADVLASGANTFLSIPDSYELPVSSDATQTNILYMITKDDGSIGTTGIKYAVPDTQGLDIDGRVGIFIDPTSLSSRILKLRNSNSSWGVNNSNNGYDKGLVFYDWINKENANSYIGGKMVLSIEGVEHDDIYKIKDIVEIPEAWIPVSDLPDHPLRVINTTFAIIADPETPFVPKIKTYANVPTTLVSSLYPNGKVMPTVNVQIGTPIAGQSYEYGENTTVSLGDNAGNNFFEGDVIKVQGIHLNGTNVTHDLYLTIDQVTSNLFPGGAVVSFTNGYSGNVADHKVTSFRMLRPNDKMFDPALMNGKKSVLARLKSTSASPTEWKHPSYDADSLSSPNPFQNVYGPVMTSSYSPGGRKFLISEILPSPNESDPNNAIAGYALIPETKANIMASTYGDNDNIIYSNSVEFEIELNNLNKGVVENLLKTVKIPYGWRLPGLGSQDASTIGINTFFTINNIAASSKVGPAMPYVSYVNSNGINYLSNPLGVYENGSSEISFNIKL